MAAKRIVCVVALCCAGAAPAAAQTGAGTYAATFLKIPVGARLMSSPDVVAGMRPDASLMYSNPAFIAGLESTGLFASSSRWLDEFSYNAAGAAIPLGKSGTVIGVGASLLYSGGIQGYDAALNVVGQESFYNLGLDMAIGHRFAGTGLSTAVGATYVREHVLPKDGSGYAFHAGASYWLGPNLVHAAVRDLGGSVSYSSDSWTIASEWLAGVARVFNSGVGQFFAGLQASASDAYGTRFRLGVDYAINGMFTLRTGLNENMDDAQTDSRFNAGFGMHYGAFSVEYAYTPQDYFSSAHTFSLGYTFGAVPARGWGVVPDGDFAPPIPETSSNVAPGARGSSTPEFILVAGAHATLESARSEARALEQANIPVEIESEGPRFRVVVGRYTSFDAASQARNRYRLGAREFFILSR